MEVSIHYLSDCQVCAGSKGNSCEDCYDAMAYFDARRIPYRKVDDFNRSIWSSTFGSVVKDLKVYPIISIGGTLIFWRDKDKIGETLSGLLKNQINVASQEDSSRKA